MHMIRFSKLRNMYRHSLYMSNIQQMRAFCADYPEPYSLTGPQIRSSTAKPRPARSAGQGRTVSRRVYVWMPRRFQLAGCRAGDKRSLYTAREDCEHQRALVTGLIRQGIAWLQAFT
jgi:hypothetical protein